MTHYILTMSDGEVIEIKANGNNFDLTIVPEIEKGQGYLIDHNQLGKKYFYRNVVSLLALDEPLYQQQVKEQLLPTMHHIGFTE